MFKRSSIHCFKTSSDVAVIGSGIVGCSIAFELAKQGLSVSVFDKSADGVGAGTTSYSSGVIRTAYSVPEVSKLAWEAYHLWTDFESYIRPHQSKEDLERLPLPKFRTRSMIMPKTPLSEKFLEAQYEMHHQNNIPVEWLNLEETKRLMAPMGVERYEHFTPSRLDDTKKEFGTPEDHDGITGALCWPRSGYISDPRLACQHVAAAAKNTGVEFYHSTEVLGIMKKAAGPTSSISSSSNVEVSGLLLKNTGDYGFPFHQAPVVINAAGPFSSFINKMAFDTNPTFMPPLGQAPNLREGFKLMDDSKVPTRAKRAEVFVTEAPAGIDWDSEDSVIMADLDTGLYMRPEVGNRLLVGSLDPECDPTEFYDSPEAVAEMCPGFGTEWEHLVFRSGIRFPKITMPSSTSAQGVVSLYDWTPDATAIVDQSSLPGFYQAIGTCGNCFKIAPLLGKLMTRLVTEKNSNSGGADGLILELPRTRESIDCKVFSRLREIDLDSASSGVMG